MEERIGNMLKTPQDASSAQFICPGKRNGHKRKAGTEAGTKEIKESYFSPEKYFTYQRSKNPQTMTNRSMFEYILVKFLNFKGSCLLATGKKHWFSEKREN